MVGKTSRCFALACLLAPAFLLPTAPLQAGEHAPAEHAASPLESLWQTIVTAACNHGISIGPGSCPSPASACEKGPLIDPNGGCAH